MSGGTYLDEIVADKRAELQDTRRDRAGTLSEQQIAEALEEAEPCRDLIAALRRPPRPRVIAEFKRASPSAGDIAADADVATVVRAYEEAGAAAISVLTDKHFKGTLDDLRAARRATTLPILRKDFILERSQILEARQAGADAVLLIAAVLQPPNLEQLVRFAHRLGMQVLCEAHDEHEVDRAMSAGCRLVGVNNRDLRTFEVDVDRSVRMRALVPATYTYVAESGIEAPSQIQRLREAGVDAVLIGSSLMGADDPGAALRALLDGR